MGSWNSTCGISNLPIFCGDKCKLILLTENMGGLSTSAGFCYPNDLRYIFSLPIDVEYDDYGSVTNVAKTDYTEFLINSINEKILNKDIKAKKAKFSSIEEICETILNGNVKIKEDYPSSLNGKRKYCTFSFMLIREDVFNSSIKSIKDNNKELRLELNKRKKDALEKSIKFVGKEYNPTITDLQIESCLFISSGGVLAECGMRISSYAKQCSSSKDKFDKFIDSIVELRALYLFMIFARKLFVEGAGKGSQTVALDLYEDYFQNMLNITKKMRTEEEKQ